VKEPRFRHIQTFTRTGRVVAEIRDQIAGRTHFIHRQGATLLHWDLGNGGDRLVENGLLRREARNALDAHTEKRLKEIGAPCRRCGNPFKSDRKNARTCNPCVSAIGRANGLKAHVEEKAA
jgi:hypothetical protein